MEEKFCNGCQKSKPQTTDYFGRRGNGFQSRCKECQGNYHKKHYVDNMASYKVRASTRNKKVIEEIREYLRKEKDIPCKDCGLKYPYYVMDFDHRPNEKKIYNLAQMARVKPSLDVVIEEVAKCDVVCSNCHRIRTHNRTKMLCPKG